MHIAVIITSLLIVLARITDMTLDTIRMAAIVQGRRMFAAVLGFFEALVYICAVAKVLLNLNQPAYVLAYALGVAAGTYFGIAIEQRLAFGHQLACLVTRKGADLATALRAAGYRLTELRGHGRDGDVAILYIELPRRQARKLLRHARLVDQDCFYVVNDVRVAQSAQKAT